MSEQMEARLTLPQVRAIALPSRIRLLRSLAKQRATLTELSNRATMPKSTALKHLRALERYGLLRRTKDERLWVYYDLTPAGRSVGALDPMRILVLVCVAFAVTLTGLAAFLYWRSSVSRSSQEPWQMPPIGVDPVSSSDQVLVAILATLALVSASVAAWLWWRRRGRAANPRSLSSDTDLSP